MSISLPRELLPSQLSIQLGVRLPILHLLDHIEPPLPEFPFFLHCSLSVHCSGLHESVDLLAEFLELLPQETDEAHRIRANDENEMDERENRTSML